MMTPEEIMMASFGDELEKIAGAKRYLRLSKAVDKTQGAYSDKMYADLMRARNKYERRITGVTRQSQEAMAKKPINTLKDLARPEARKALSEMPRALARLAKYQRRVGVPMLRAGVEDTARAATKAGPK